MTKEFDKRQKDFMAELRDLMKKYDVDIISLVHIVDTKEPDKTAIAVENN